jgi:integrase/recombinase XerD
MGAYRDHLVAAGLAENTIRNYEMRMRQAKAWCDRHGHRLSLLEAAEMRELSDAFHKSHTVIGQLKSALNYFYQMKGRDDPPLKAIRVPVQPPGRNRALEPEHVRALHKTARFWVPEGTAVMFGLYLGMRVTEIASAQWSRFDREREWYTVYGKGDRSRTIPVHPTLREDLQYVHARGDHIFPGSGTRHHVGSNTVWNWCLKVGVEAGIPRFTTHQLRHTAITEIYDRTGDLLVAQEFAGHSRPDVTRRYTRLNVRRLVDAVNAINYEAD